MKILLTNVSVFNGRDNKIFYKQYIVVNKNKIETINDMSELNKQSINEFDQVIDLKGKFLMPGLIDAHVHLTTTDIHVKNDITDTLIGIQSTVYMKFMLENGFTTVRDAGGADWGMSLAVDNGIVPGPRIFRSEKALTQTNGHGDLRAKSSTMQKEFVSDNSGTYIATVCDGVDAIRKAAREQLRKGASQIKIMAAGGVASPSDKINSLQFSIEEIKAVVEEAENAGTYVMAHVYTPKGIIRCIELGVKSIEHGNLINDEAAEVVKKYNAYVVPTLSIYESLYNNGTRLGFPEVNIQKLSEVRSQSLEGLRICRKHNVNIGFGSDLLGDLQFEQCNEFKLRSKIETPFETLNSATYVNAKLLDMEGKLGLISQNAFADMIVMDSNPLESLTEIANDGKSLKLIIKDGKIVKNTLKK